MSNYYSFGDFDTWMHDVGEDRTFRMWVYKKMFTPYEQHVLSPVESEYDNDECYFVRIREVITLPDGNLLLGIQYVYDEEDESATADNCSMEYYKLGEIHLAYFPSDNVVEDK